MSDGRDGPRHLAGTDDPIFHTSSYSGGENCLEVGALADGGVVLRDTKDPFRATTLKFNRAEWRAFLLGAKDGEFDT
jgi:Domain of unknown function (DUF397)